MSNESNDLFYIQISRDHIDMCKWLSNEQRGLLFKLVFDYFMDQSDKQHIFSEVPEVHSIILPILDNMVTGIERSREAYKKKCLQNRENGKKGGAPKGNQNARKKKTLNEDEDEENKKLLDLFENMSNEEFEEFNKEQNQNSTLAHQYYCFSTELKKNGYSVSMFFNWKQLVEFMNYYTVLHMMYIFHGNSIKSFFAVFTDGFNGFINMMNELGTNGLIDGIKKQILDISRQDMIDREINPDEAEKNAKELVNLISNSESTEEILLDIADIDEELQILANNIVII